jgi:alpha-L-rhamnosidase
MGLVCLFASVVAAAPPRLFVTEKGAIADGVTLNTTTLQAAIDECAASGGGTLVFPKGEFLSGALFLKPGVNIELTEGAVLKGSKDFADFPVQEHVRFEGHFQTRVTSLLNLDHCPHFHLTGPGTLDGNGAVYWRADSSMGRPRLCEICNSDDVLITGVHFQNSPSWNLHLYNCKDSSIEDCRFEIPDKARGPSTDGTDIDSSQNITVKNCYYSVNDDCICLKGNRYDGLDQEPKSLPVENIHVVGCTFARGMGAVTLGTEATIIRDVEFENSTVSGNFPMLRIKLRPDTVGQNYSKIHVHDIKLSGTGPILSLEPAHGTKVPAEKAATGTVTNVTVESISGNFGSFGTMSGESTNVRDITLRNIDVKLSRNSRLRSAKIVNLNMENVVINGQPATVTQPATQP